MEPASREEMVEAACEHLVRISAIVIAQIGAS
jgi:hypothetical protein